LIRKCLEFLPCLDILPTPSDLWIDSKRALSLVCKDILNVGKTCQPVASWQ
jgi:hypothetical protein